MSRCKSCKASILWAESEAGKRVPVEKKEGGNLVLDGDLFGKTETPIARYVGDGKGTHVAHFATCPDADAWRGTS